MNSLPIVESFYPQDNPSLAVVSFEGIRYVVGLKQQIHQQAIEACLDDKHIMHLCVSGEEQTISIHHSNQIRAKIAGLDSGALYQIALTLIYDQAAGIESGHTVSILFLKNTHEQLFVTLINQSAHLRNNAPYLSLYHQIVALVPHATVLGINGCINGLMPFGSVFYMCMESTYLFYQIHQTYGSDVLVNLLQQYAGEHKAALTAQKRDCLTYEQICALPHARAFYFDLEHLSLLRFFIAYIYRSKLDIQDKIINGQTATMDYLLDRTLIPPEAIVRYLAGCPVPQEGYDALEQNLLETLPAVSLRELGSPENLVDFFSRALTTPADTSKLEDFLSDLDWLFDDTTQQAAIETPLLTIPSSLDFLRFSHQSFCTDILYMTLDEAIAQEPQLEAKALIAAQGIVAAHYNTNKSAVYDDIVGFLKKYRLDFEELIEPLLPEHVAAAQGNLTIKQCLLSYDAAQFNQFLQQLIESYRAQRRQIKASC